MYITNLILVLVLFVVITPLQLYYFLLFPDFDECINDEFNDCSMHGQCFNLLGSYTCSCPEGYMDISENPIYPGRQCSDHVIGCEKCNYHGNCVSLNESQVQCECFVWYSGVSCQLNLKILLIFMISIGSLVVLLLLFILLFYARHAGKHRANLSTFISTSNYHQPTVFATSSLQKHVKLMDDSISESSHNSELYIFQVRLTEF